MGKTHLAVAIALALMEQKKIDVLFCEQRALLKALQGTFDSGAKSSALSALIPAAVETPAVAIVAKLA